MVNKLKNSMVYVAGNIEYTENAVDWREYVKNDLNKIGVKVLSPLNFTFIDHIKEGPDTKKYLADWRHIGEYDDISRHMKRVVQKDLRLIDKSDFVIFNLEITKPTFGTIHELIVALSQKKPVFLIVKKSECPFWLFGIISHHSMYDTIDEALDSIHKINSGEILMDENKWRILVEELR
jgi:nucleoside 2-deoxyribosyltransferase